MHPAVVSISVSPSAFASILQVSGINSAMESSYEYPQMPSVSTFENGTEYCSPASTVYVPVILGPL